MLFRLRFISCVVIVAFSILQGTCASTTTVTIGGDTASSTEAELEGMSNEALEAICIDRGFYMLAKDNTFTHEDYVQAAKQCLAIEQEMRDLIEKNPNILEELEAEQEKMLAEKKRLEKELERARENLSNNEQATRFVAKTKTLQEKNATTNPDEQKEADAENTTTDETEIEEESLKSTRNVHDNEPVVDDETMDGVANEPTTEDFVDSPPITETAPSEEEVLEEAKMEDTKEQTHVGDESSEQKERPKKLVALLEEGSIDLEAMEFKEYFILTLRLLAEEMYSQLRFVTRILLPKPVQRSLRPILRILRDSGLTTVDLLKRYTVAIFKSAASANKSRKQAQNKDGQAVSSQ